MHVARKGRVNSPHDEVEVFGSEHDDANDASDPQQMRATCGRGGASKACAKPESVETIAS